MLPASPNDGMSPSKGKVLSSASRRSSLDCMDLLGSFLPDTLVLPNSFFYIKKKTRSIVNFETSLVLL